MGRAIDLFVTYRFIKLLVTPFNKTPAFKLGIIDAEGKRVMRKTVSRGMQPTVLITDAEKMDLERDKLEAQTSIDLMKVSADADKQKNTDAVNMLKENIVSSREAMKQQSAERIARSKTNGQRTNKNKR